MTKPFFISPPRTRSTILYESLKTYISENTDLLPVNGHSEPFLHTLQNRTVVDPNGKQFLTEMYPVMTDKSINIHYVYPWIYGSNKESILQKIEQLKIARSNGNEYYMKGTYNMAEALDEVLEFFSDYDIILTLRKDISELVVSMLFATQSKFFHLREDNKELYKARSDKGITVRPEVLSEIGNFLDKVSKIYRLTSELPDAKVFYHEDLNSVESIDAALSDIVGEKFSVDYTDKRLPIKMENDYSKLIHNYDEVKEITQREINARTFY